MTSQTGKQTIGIHILPSISRTKGNQRMKLRHLIEQIIRNIFREKYTQNVIEKKSKWSISLNQ